MRNENTSEVSLYFEDILKNKEMIKEMFKTNIMVYEDKLKQNKAKSNSIKEDLDKLNSDFQLVENKLKLEYAKSHDEFQKHDINCKLLDKTLSHYKMLVRERENEIKKIEEQSIYAQQDYQNKKVKRDCLAVQIVEAEFQLKSLQKQIDEKLNKLKEDHEDEEELHNFNTELGNSKHIIEGNPQNQIKSKSLSCPMPNLDISEITKIENPSIKTDNPHLSVNQFLKEKMPYKSTYADQGALIETLSINQDLPKKNCLLF
jgi:hypothetical protein